MRISTECHSCVLNQARSAAHYGGLDEEQSRRVVAVAEAGLVKSNTAPILVQHIVREVADAVIRELGESPDFDIYSTVKRESNTLSLASAAELEKKLVATQSPFELGIQIAAAGNIIDFGAKSHGVLDIEKELLSLTDRSFTRYDVSALCKSIESASQLLYICDNAGEIVFDMLLLRVMKRIWPKLKLVAAVRDKPIINDATIIDAEAVGLTDVVQTISSGSIYPGTVLSETSPEFQLLYESADVIVAKGQGNFETLLPEADRRLFFLLRIKCDYMASLAQVDRGDLVLMQGGKH